MRVVAFGASNHSASINARLASLAGERFTSEFRADAQVELLDLNDFEMPIYSLDRERDTGIPELAQSLFAQIGSADALIISFAEYNGTYTSAWKNIHDWMSRIEMKIYQGKATLALAATPGPRAGAGVLQAVTSAAPHFGMDLRASVGVGKWSEAYDATTSRLTRSEDVAALDAGLAALSR
ncbi:MAG: NAD(P)H-dependent oxidoreductase [Pseudomonadota bacterium]